MDNPIGRHQHEWEEVGTGFTPNLKLYGDEEIVNGRVVGTKHLYQQCVTCGATKQVDNQTI